MSLSDVCAAGKFWSHHANPWCDCEREATFCTFPVEDESRLADMAPALALMRADPLGSGDAVTFTFSAHFEAWPDLWRRNAIGVHTRGEWPLSEPLP